MGLIFLFSLPILAAWQGQNTAFGITDIIISISMLIFILLEAIADNQQYKFQTSKYDLISNNSKLTGDFKKGFLQYYFLYNAIF